MGTLLPENRTEHKHSDVDDPDPLNLAVRSQTNFCENVSFSSFYSFNSGLGAICVIFDCIG